MEPDISLLFSPESATNFGTDPGDNIKNIITVPCVIAPTAVIPYQCFQNSV